MKLLSLLFLLTLAACSKSDNKPCYDCEVVRMNGSHYNTTVCDDDIDSWQTNLKDSSGNALQSVCVPQ